MPAAQFLADAFRLVTMELTYSGDGSIDMQVLIDGTRRYTRSQPNQGGTMTLTQLSLGILGDLSSTTASEAATVRFDDVRCTQE